MLFLVVLLGGLGAYIAYFAHGSASQLNPKGIVAAEQARLMFVSAAIVLAVAVPTVLVLYFVAWKYRASNTRATYRSETRNNKTFVVSIWAIPTATMLLLAFILVPITHQLDPKKQSADGQAPLTIQVVALRWKWLFLYPDQHIATINTITIPKDQPVTFELTADDAPMSSFWIPNLGGQLYAMTGHVNRLNVIANQTGNYSGSSAEINGPGFADMKFTARVTSEQDFHSWVNQVKQRHGQLTDVEYNHLLTPGNAVPATDYSGYTDGLYNTIVMKYVGSHHMEGM